MLSPPSITTIIDYQKKKKTIIPFGNNYKQFSLK